MVGFVDLGESHDIMGKILGTRIYVHVGALNYNLCHLCILHDHHTLRFKHVVTNFMMFKIPFLEIIHLDICKLTEQIYTSCITNIIYTFI